MEGSNLIQFLTFAAMMASSIFIPILAQNFGASLGMIGLIIGAYNAFFLLSNYLFGALSDKYGGKYFLRMGLLISVACFALQILSKDVASIIFLRSLAGFAAGIFPAALAVYSFAEHQGKMGKYAGYGSLGWGIGAILAGIISNNQTIFLMSSIFFFFAFLFSLQMDHHHFKKQESVSFFPFRLIKRNARIYIPYFFRALGAQAIWTIFPLYLVWTGAGSLWVGMAYFFNTGTQFFIMQYVEKYRNLYLFNIGLLCTIATFIGYALFPYLPAVMLFQFLLAFSFSTLQVGALQELLEKNMGQSTAMGLLNSISNFTAVIGPFLAGAIAQFYGYGGVMWFGAVTTFVGLVCFTTVLE